LNRISTLGLFLLVFAGISAWQVTDVEAQAQPASPHQTATQSNSPAQPEDGSRRQILIDRTDSERPPLSLPWGLSLPSPKAFDRFFAKLRALQQGIAPNARITVWGASHIAGEGFTGQLRRRLQAAFGDGGPGFSIIGRPWRSHRHSAAAFGEEGRWRTERFRRSYPGRRTRKPRDTLCGIAGVSIHSRKKASTWIRPRGKRNIATADLFFLRQRRGGYFEVSADGAKLQTVYTNARRKAAGYARIDLPTGTRELSLTTENGEVRLFGADMKSGQPGVILDALGINGASPSTIEGCDAKLMAEHSQRLAPDLIVMAYGSNSVDNKSLTPERLEQNFGKFLRRMRKMAPQADCLVIGPGDQARRAKGSGWRVPESLSWIISTEKKVALAQGCAFWDWQQTMGGHNGVFMGIRAVPPQIRADHLHLTSFGYRLYGDVFYESLMLLWNSYLERQ
jgi:hypothetical protein